MLPTILAFVAVGAGPVPVLLDPVAGAAAAGAVEDPRVAAEMLLLSGRPAEARAKLPRQPEDPRALRIVADAYVAEVRAADGLAALDALEAHEGWQKHVRHQRARLGKRVWYRRGGRMGLALFAICLATLGLAGARELLRVHPSTVALAVVGLAAAGVSRGAGPVAGMLGAVFGMSLVVLGHAATATVIRTRAGPRGRLFVATLFLFGFAGAVTAVVLQVGVGPLIGGLSVAVTGTSG